jgi:hypothetical protein
MNTWFNFLTEGMRHLQQLHIYDTSDGYMRKNLLLMQNRACYFSVSSAGLGYTPATNGYFMSPLSGGSMTEPLLNVRISLQSKFCCCRILR